MDIRHLILAYNTSIQVYSTADSLLIRKIQLEELDVENIPGQIMSICISPSSPNLIWVASSDGHVWLIDWTNGQGSETLFKLQCSFLSDMSVEHIKFGTEFRDVPLVAIEHKKKWRIVACDVRRSKFKSSNSLLTQAMPISNLRSVRNGYALIASADRNILLGTLKTSSIQHVSELEYEFFTLDCSDEIVCLDVRATDRVHLNRKTQVEAGNEPVVEIVVGCARGAVFFYNDILPQIRRLHSSKGHRGSLQPRKYHWHRKAVHTIKWSRDGMKIFLILKY